LYYALAFAGLSLGVIRTGIIALGVYTGAYMGEVVRAAIEAVPKGQFEAAPAQGRHISLIQNLQEQSRIEIYSIKRQMWQQLEKQKCKPIRLKAYL